MGTSGAYGGSDRQGWNRARELVHDLAEGGASSGTGDGPGNSEPGDDPPVGDLWQTIADVLTGEDPFLGGPPPADQTMPLSDLLPRPRVPRGGGGGGGPAGVVRGMTGASGRRGFRSTRTVIRGAARGGAAIGGAYALLRGDASGLADLGLNLTELRTLNPRMRCARILDAVIGDGGHPDDTALRRAAAEALKEIILSGRPPSEIDALRGFVAHYVFELCLVEIQRQVTGGSMDPAEAASVEKRLQDFLDARVRILDFPHEGTLSNGVGSARPHTSAVEPSDAPSDSRAYLPTIRRHPEKPSSLRTVHAETVAAAGQMRDTLGGHTLNLCSTRAEKGR